jgi:acetolactate synthase-1/2/3 large subunit
MDGDAAQAGGRTAPRGADRLAEGLARSGCSRVFALSGNQIMPVFDALQDVDVALVHTRHEAAAVFMAEAHAQLTGEVGVALVTAGPGFGNALGALYAAQCSETPLVLLAGDSPRAADGSGAFQTLDQCAAAAPFVKARLRVGAPGDLGHAVGQAAALARAGRPGPVHLALPADVLAGDAASTGAPLPALAGPPVAPPCARDVAAVADLLSRAARPLVLTGPALSPTRAAPLLAALEAGLGATVVCLDSPRGLRDPAGGDLAGLFGRADVVVALGRRLDFACAAGATPPFDPAASWAVIDAEAEARAAARAALGPRAVACIAAEPAAFAQALLEADPAAPDRTTWRAEAAALRAARSAAPAAAAGTITAPMVAHALARTAADATVRGREALLVCDGGEFGQWVQAGVGGLPRVINGPSGAIGAAPAYAIAAALARPDAVVLAAMGDGTAGFHLAEFETAARAGAAFVCVVGADRLWNAEYQIQLRDYGPGRARGCTLAPARYDLAAAALGARAARVTAPEDLAPALAEAVAARRPALVQVEIVPLAAPAPPGPTA